MRGSFSYQYNTAFNIAMAAVRRERKQLRENKLATAVYSGGMVPGVRVMLRNGVRGTIVKVNKTRFKIQAEDGRMWSAHPGAMQVLKVR